MHTFRLGINPERDNTFKMSNNITSKVFKVVKYNSFIQLSVDYFFSGCCDEEAQKNVQGEMYKRCEETCWSPTSF